MVDMHFLDSMGKCLPRKKKYFDHRGTKNARFFAKKKCVNLPEQKNNNTQDWEVDRFLLHWFLESWTAFMQVLFWQLSGLGCIFLSVFEFNVWRDLKLILPLVMHSLSLMGMGFLAVTRLWFICMVRGVSLPPLALGSFYVLWCLLLLPSPFSLGPLSCIALHTQVLLFAVQNSGLLAFCSSFWHRKSILRKEIGMVIFVLAYILIGIVALLLFKSILPSSARRGKNTLLKKGNT